MTQFNWSEQIQDAVFKTWLETGGDEVKIAVLDTGVDLTHPALKHLNKPGHKFNAAIPGFNPALPNQFGNGDVMDAHRKKGHGTHCSSVLAAVAEGENTLLGMAPKAEVFIVKINTVDNKFFRVKDFLKGLEAAALLGVDIVVASITYPKGNIALEGITDAEIERVFGVLRRSGAVLFGSLPNTDETQSWVGLAQKQFPNLRPETVNIGAISRAVFDARKAEIAAQPDVHFLVSNAVSHFCKINNEYVQEAISSSYGAYLVAGVAALYLSSIKKREKEAYQRRPQGDFLKGMGQKFLELTATATWDGTKPVFYKTAAVEV